MWLVLSNICLSCCLFTQSGKSLKKHKRIKPKKDDSIKSNINDKLFNTEILVNSAIMAKMFVKKTKLINITTILCQGPVKKEWDPILIGPN